MSAEELTPTMRAALKEIKREEGQLAAHLPGGTRTVEALMRRSRVEVAGQDWRVYLPEHEHRFVPGMHIDMCHSFENRGTCECGAVYHSVIERSLNTDPWSAVWMGETGESCERCRQLQRGARPRALVIIARRGE
jgi:hypothetical protein